MDRPLGKLGDFGATGDRRPPTRGKEKGKGCWRLGVTDRTDKTTMWLPPRKRPIADDPQSRIGLEPQKQTENEDITVYTDTADRHCRQTLQTDNRPKPQNQTHPPTPLGRLCNRRPHVLARRGTYRYISYIHVCTCIQYQPVPPDQTRRKVRMDGGSWRMLADAGGWVRSVVCMTRLAQGSARAKAPPNPGAHSHHSHYPLTAVRLADAVSRKNLASRTSPPSQTTTCMM